MFETNNEVVKVFSQGKLTSVKIKKMPNNKKKRPADPDFVAKAVVDVATFDKNTGKQIDCVSSYLDIKELYVFIEALIMYGRKAMHISVCNSTRSPQEQQKMPAARIFEKKGGKKYQDGNVIARTLTLSSPGPEKKAEFFITAEEAPGHIDKEKGIYIKNAGAKSTKWITMSLTSSQLLAIANGCKSAIDVLNLWSAMGTLESNLERITPKTKSVESQPADNRQIQPRQQAPQQRGYAAQGGYDQGYGQDAYGQQAGYAAQGGYQQQGNYMW